MAERPAAGDIDRTEIDLEALWKSVIEVLHRGPVNRSLWDAVARAKPLTIENGYLVLGFRPEDMRFAGYIETSANRARIQEILLARTGHRLQIRCIEGATLQDWERVKQIERLAEQRAEERVRVMEARRESVRAWEDLNEALVKLFTATTLRRYPVNLARMFAKALPMVYETDTQVRANDPEGEAYHDRELNRICDKLGSYCDLPPTVVAMEYLRYKASRKGGASKPGPGGQE
ncbi:MAG: hypothetical protein H5T86_02795 [Armatimonadetes bacterium]|nr:hypothetical protein [Armatimonadota bacterium]